MPKLIHALLLYTVIMFGALTVVGMFVFVLYVNGVHAEYLIHQDKMNWFAFSIKTSVVIVCGYLIYKVLAFCGKLTKNLIFFLRNPFNEIDVLFDELL